MSMNRFHPAITAVSFFAMATLLSGCQSQSKSQLPQAPATVPVGTLTALTSDAGYVYLSGKWEVLSLTGKDGAPTGQFQSIDFAPSGTPMATTVGNNDEALQGNQIELWKYDQGWQEVSVNGDNTVVKYAWSPTKTLYAVPDDGQTQGIWSLSNGNWQEINGSSSLGFVNSIQWSAKGNLTVSSEASDGSSSVWEYANNHWTRLTPGNAPFAADGFQVAWSPTGVLTLATSRHGVWQYIGGSWNQAGGVASPIDDVMQVGWSPTGNLLISGNSQKSTGLWELQNGQWSQVGGEHSPVAKDGIRQFGWSPSGVLTASDSTTGELYQFSSGRWINLWSALSSANRHNPVPVTFKWSSAGVLTCTGGPLGGLWQYQNGSWTQIGGDNSPLKNQQPVQFGWSFSSPGSRS